jgi:hypothetical protein
VTRRARKQESHISNQLSTPAEFSQASPPQTKPNSLIFVHATSIFRAPLYFKVGRDKQDQVFTADRDVDNTEVLAESVDEFLQLLTRAIQVT